VHAHCSKQLLSTTDLRLSIHTLRDFLARGLAVRCPSPSKCSVRTVSQFTDGTIAGTCPCLGFTPTPERRYPTIADRCPEGKTIKHTIPALGIMLVADWIRHDLSPATIKDVSQCFVNYTSQCRPVIIIQYSYTCSISLFTTF
jgi:hypothetical protein